MDSQRTAFGTAGITYEPIDRVIASALTTADRRFGHGILLALFFFAVLLPINFGVGSIRMNPSRLYLLLCAIPFGFRLFTGRAGGVTWVDGCMVGFVTLVVATLLYHHGTAELAYALSQVVEMFGGYMAGRILIRSLADYRRYIRFFLLALLVMLPFAIDEMLHHRMLLTDILSKAFAVVWHNGQSRFGLSRVQVVFPHAILYGLFCSLALASAFVCYQKQPFRWLAYLALVMGMTLMSLSSAPMLSILMQFALITWGKITRGSWKLLAGMVGVIFLLLQLFTHRGAFVIFIETMTLDPATGWYRIFIWDWGWHNVVYNPFLGIGLNDWVRPDWMYSSSVDNFWLLMAMRYGLPAVATILTAFLLHITFILRARNLSPEAQTVRTGYVITLVGLIFILTTVDIWDAVQVFVMFFLGAGAFFYTADQSDAAAPTIPVVDQRSGQRFSRFPQTVGITRRRDYAESGEYVRPAFVSPHERTPQK